eukprot:evm.model.NODE_37254_length_10195_cov_59.340656.1
MARAALDLLMVLHARLDVMVTGKVEGEGGREEGGQSKEWIENWATILDALAKAAEDRRLSKQQQEQQQEQQQQHLPPPVTALKEAPQPHEQQQQHQRQQEEGGPPRPIPEGTMAASRSWATIV